MYFAAKDSASNFLSPTEFDARVHRPSAVHSAANPFRPSQLASPQSWTWHGVAGNGHIGIEVNAGVCVLVEVDTQSSRGKRTTSRASDSNVEALGIVLCTVESSGAV